MRILDYLAPNPGASILAELEMLRRKVEALPGDWLEDSSLETWFPLTAQKLEELRAEVERLRAENAELQGSCQFCRDTHIADLGMSAGEVREIIIRRESTIKSLITQRDTAVALARGGLERIIGMCDVPERCTCGRPNGIGAVVASATSTLSALDAQTGERGQG